MMASAGAFHLRPKSPLIPAQAPRRAAVSALSVIEDEQSWSSALNSSIAVVHCSSTFCRGCKAVLPFYSQISRDWPEVDFYHIVCDKNMKLARSVGIKSVPHFMIFVEGNKIANFTGGKARMALLERMLAEHVPYSLGWRRWQQWPRYRWRRARRFALRPRWLGGRERTAAARTEARRREPPKATAG